MSVACVGADSAAREVVRETLALTLPGAGLRDLAATQGRDAKPGEIVVVCEPTAGAAMETLRLLRASGFAFGAVIVGDVDAGSADLARWSPARALPPASVPRELAETLAALADLDARPDDPANDSLRRTRRFLAAGEVALGLQHAINNPLTALLAEAQLLELEELSKDHREAVERIITQCRRVIQLVRSLDGISERKAP